MAYKKLKFWFDKDLARLLSEKLETVHHNFPSDQFIAEVDSGVEQLELKDRVELIADQLHYFLGNNIETNIQVLSSILGPENKEETGMFTEYYWIMPIAKYVEKYGIDHFDLSMHALAEITKRNTSEYAIRPFIEVYQEQTLEQMLIWSTSENFHLRRLSSEGVRPRLPWASKLEEFVKDPTPILPILENLKDDPIRFIQKSVANCLNDISKDNRTIFETVIHNWKAKNLSNTRKWIIKHSLRKLKQKNDPWAIKILSDL